MLEAQSLVPVSEAQFLQTTPPTLLITGQRDFESIDEVRVNDIPAPFFIVQAARRILAQVPDGVTGPQAVVTVISSNLQDADHVLLRHRLGKRSRKVGGISRLLQMYVRLLLMSPGTSLLNPKLGAGLLSRVRSGYSPGDVKDLQADVYLAVSKAADQLITLQAREPRTPRDERLLSARITNCNVHPQTRELMVGIELRSQAGRRFLADFAM